MNKLKFAIFSIIIILALYFVHFLTYTFVEPKAYDFMVKHSLTEKLPFDKNKQVYGSGDVILVMIDAKTAEKYRWPWKRETNCKLFEYFIKYAHPKVVVHDSILAALDKDNPESDRKFFNTLNKFDNLISGFMPSSQIWNDRNFGDEYEKIFAEKYALNVENKTSFLPDIYFSLIPFPKPYFNVIKHTGSVTMFPGFISGNLSSYAMDETYRTHEYLIAYKGVLYPSLALRVFLFVHDNPKIRITNSYLEFPDLKYRITYKKTKYQIATPIKFYKFYNGYSHPKFSAVDIMDSYDNLEKGLEPVINPKIFKDKIVIIGANVPAGTGLNDVKTTPIFRNHPGADIQAAAIDNIMHNDFLKILPVWLNIFLTILGMLCVYGIIRFYDLFKSSLFITFLLAGYFALSALCFYFGIVINVITPPVMFVVTMILAYTHKFILENRSKEKVKSAMGKYMSEDVMKRVIMNIDNLGLGGKKAVVTVLFADIRGFTSMSETMSAQQVSEILNEYFTEMEPIISKYNGIINKFIGDAVMAIFGEPIQDKNHALNAVKCGYEMLLKVKELQKKWAEEGKPKIEIGVGINTGEVFVGNIGSVNRMEYTVIGDTVNLASRLESYNKVYKTKMLISSSTYEETKSFIDVIRISDVEIRGKSHKMDIYEVLKVIY